MFGFGKGKIEITLEKVNFKPGETIKGKLILKMKKPTKAKELRVQFAGIKTTSGSGISFGSSNNQRKTTTQYIHNFKLTLDGEKEYTDKEYDFEITIPTEILRTGGSLPEGTAGTAIKTLQFLSGSSTRINWFIQGTLDIEKSLDINKKIQINVA